MSLGPTANLLSTESDGTAVPVRPAVADGAARPSVVSGWMLLILAASILLLALGALPARAFTHATHRPELMERRTDLLLAGGAGVLGVAFTLLLSYLPLL